MNDSFKGFWIPIQLMEYDISWTKRVLIAEISHLEMLEKGCVASNNHFAHKLKISKQAVSKAINELAKDGFIKIDNSESKRNYGRIITINFSVPPIHQSVPPIHQSGESKGVNNNNKQIDRGKTAKTIKEKQKDFLNKLKPFKEKYSKDMLNSFYLHWTEPNKSKTKIRYDNENFFDFGKRLARWKLNDDKWNKNGFEKEEVSPPAEIKPICEKGDKIKARGKTFTVRFVFGNEVYVAEDYDLTLRPDEIEVIK